MKYDEIFDTMTAEDFDSFMKTLSTDDILDYRASRDTPLAEDAASEGFQAYKRKLSSKTQYEFKDATLRKLEDYYQAKAKNHEDAIMSAKGEKSITDANTLELNAAERQLAHIKELKNPEGTPYSEMSEYQKYRFGQEFGLNYFNDEDRKKLDETATKLQEHARIKRQQAKFETEHPWKNLALDIFAPASQNARRRGEEPSNIDIGLDVASNAATFIPLVGPAAKLGLAAKIASKLKSPAAKIATKLAPAATDVAANTAVTTAIDARNQKAEDEDFGTYTPQQLAKNLGTAAAGTMLSGLATRKSIPDFARLKVDPYVPNASKFLESKLVNPAETIRDEILRKNEITSSLAKASTGKFYPQEVKDILKKYGHGYELTPDELKLLHTYGITPADLEMLDDQIRSHALATDLKKSKTTTAKRVDQLTKDEKLANLFDADAHSWYHIGDDLTKKVLDAERKRRT